MLAASQTGGPGSACYSCYSVTEQVYRVLNCRSDEDTSLNLRYREKPQIFLWVFSVNPQSAAHRNNVDDFNICRKFHVCTTTETRRGNESSDTLSGPQLIMRMKELLDVFQTGSFCANGWSGWTEPSPTSVLTATDGGFNYTVHDLQVFTICSICSVIKLLSAERHHRAVRGTRDVFISVSRRVRCQESEACLRFF